MLQGCQVSSPSSYFLSRCGIVLASILGISNCSVDEPVAFIPFCSTHSEHNFLGLITVLVPEQRIMKLLSSFFYQLLTYVCVCVAVACYKLWYYIKKKKKTLNNLAVTLCVMSFCRILLHQYNKIHVWESSDDLVRASVKSKQWQPADS